jgi:hypothetical protein
MAKSKRQVVRPPSRVTNWSVHTYGRQSPALYNRALRDHAKGYWIVAKREHECVIHTFLKSDALLCESVGNDVMYKYRNDIDWDDLKVGKPFADKHFGVIAYESVTQT